MRTCVHVLVDIIPELHLHIIEADILLNLKLANSGRLACEKAPGIFPSPPPQVWDYSHIQSHIL